VSGLFVSCDVLSDLAYPRSSGFEVWTERPAKRLVGTRTGQGSGLLSSLRTLFVESTYATGTSKVAMLPIVNSSVREARLRRRIHTGLALTEALTS
jgi:hypothetical protein